MRGLETLMTDHERLRKMLATLKQQVIADHAADLHEMHAVITKYIEYFDHVHRPREAQAFACLLGGADGQHDIAEQVVRGHDEVKEQLDLLWSLLDEALQAQAMIGEDIVHLTAQFLDTQLNNMAYEELIAFAWLRDASTEDEWAVID